MINSDHDRRSSWRCRVNRPCKIYDPRGQKYHAGRTCDVSTGGMLIRSARKLPLEIGDRVFVGTQQKRSQPLIHSDQMLEAGVVRMMELTSGEASIALEFTHPTEHTAPLRLAA